jgi:hypothetical protein
VEGTVPVRASATEPGDANTKLSTGAAMADAPRRFPPPWRVDKIPAGYVVRDANGQALAWVYSRADPTEAAQAKVLSADEGRRIAGNIARLPELPEEVEYD